MGKRIVICCDGTWNFPDKSKDGKPCHTNVVKIAQSVKSYSNDEVRQITYYDPGVGTSGSWFKRCLDGATGAGISKNIIEAYKYLIINYEIGDELFFFGFSRGAFTVRSLVGLICNSGILQPSYISLVDRAFKLYKSKLPSTYPREKEATLFRKTYSVSDIIPIKFMGVWDTVGSLGNPLFINNIFSRLSISVVGNQFHDTNLSRTVENAYQALAIDEKRRNFIPSLWQEQSSSKGKLIKTTTQILEQVWFVGVHSNVGGGYPSTDLSDFALGWMIKKSESCQLDLDKIPTDPKFPDKREESWKGLYKLIFKHYRPIGIKKNGNEKVHESALKHFNENALYNPKNLTKYLRNL